MRRSMKAVWMLAFGGLVVGCASWPCCKHQTGPGPMPPEPEHAVVSAVEVEDAIEVALLEQEIGLMPVRLEERTLYYVPDAAVSRRLEELGYQPKGVDGAQVYRRVMKATGGEDDDVREAGVTVLLREEDHRVVYGTIQQLRVLARLGVRLEEVRRDPRPRQVRVLVGSAEDVRAVAEAGVDVYSSAPARAEQEQKRRQRYEQGYVVYGGAFDDAIDRLRERDFDVEVLPDPSEVER